MYKKHKDIDTRNNTMNQLARNIRVLNENKFFHVWGLIIAFPCVVNTIRFLLS